MTVFCSDSLIQTCKDFGKALVAKWFLPFSASIPFSVKKEFIKILGVWFRAERAALKSLEETLPKMK